VSVEGTTMRVGAALPDVKVARAAQEWPRQSCIFTRLPGCIGGALRMNGGAYGQRTKDAWCKHAAPTARAIFPSSMNADMHYSYRHCGAPEDIIFTQALFAGEPGDKAKIARR